MISYQFQIALPTAVAPPGQWLRGTSSNYTPPNADPSEPDYVIEQALNPSLVVSADGLSASVAQVSDPTDVTTFAVTSHDFGGVAQLRATATIQGIAPDGTVQAVTVTATVVDNFWDRTPDCLAI